MSFRSLWVLLGIPLVAAGLAAEVPIITGIGLIITVAIALSRLWSRRLFNRLNLKIPITNSRIYQDEETHILIELENRKFLPLPWLRIVIQLSNELEVTDENIRTIAGDLHQTVVLRGSIGWYEKKSWKIPITSKHRGNFRIDSPVIHTSDLFGLFPRKQQFNVAANLIVYPKIIELTDLGFPADRPLGESKGRNQLFEDPLRIAGLRDYEPGDSLRRIDWKATARKGEIQSKVYEPSAAQHLYVFMNIDTLSHSWEGFLPEHLERTISVAASISVWATTVKFAVGLLANGSLLGSDRPLRLPPSRSKVQILRILESLAAIQPLTMGTLAGSIRREVSRL
ncbi:uncharacterized protein METZ01_LOCUS285583, partial [marine metagenome]